MKRDTWFAILLGATVCATSIAQEESFMKPLVELDAATADRWQIVNDGVMGGLSRSRFSFEEGLATFEGVVSLANNGGFASVRTSLDDTDWGDWDGIELRAEGDGETFQVSLRTNEAWDGLAYRARFQAPGGAIGTIRVPFSEFQPTWRGRIVEDAPPLDPSRLAQFGFLIADGHRGPFRLRVKCIRAYRDGATTEAAS